MAMGELFDFEELADECADEGALDVCMCRSNVSRAGWAGSPVNAVAIR